MLQETEGKTAVELLHASRELVLRQEPRVSVIIFVKDLGNFVVGLDIHEPELACPLAREHRAKGARVAEKRNG